MRIKIDAQATELVTAVVAAIPSLATRLRELARSGVVRLVHGDVDLLPDDGYTLRARFEESGEPPIEIQVDHPSAPTRAVVSHTVEITGHRAIRGTVEFHAALAVDRLPPVTANEPQLVASLRHPRLHAHAEALVSADGDNGWLMSVHMRLRGRGLARPAVAIFAPVVRWAVKEGVVRLLKEGSQWSAAAFSSDRTANETIVEAFLRLRDPAS